MSENSQISNVSSQSDSKSEKDDANGKTNLIVNYLPQSMSDKDLYLLFAPYGPIQCVRIVRDAKTGYSFGYGFVTCGSEEKARKAIDSLSGLQLEGKTIKVSFARPPGDAIKDTNLYVTNFPRHYRESDLETLFGPYGTIVQRKVLLDKFTSMPRGVGFVRFEKKEEAQAALAELNGHIPEGATEALQIRVAENHSQEKAAYYAGFQQGYNLIRGGGRGGGHHQNQQRFQPYRFYTRPPHPM